MRIASAGDIQWKTRILLDTNIWRYIVDAKLQGRLLRVAENGHYRVQIAPAVVYETLRYRDRPLRSKLISVMTSSRLERLMPEAYTESLEILEEAKRHRPDWLHADPDTRLFNRIEKYWTRKSGGFWVRCARSPEREASILAPYERSIIDGARAEASRQRQEMIGLRLPRMPSLNTITAKLLEPHPGWSGEPVEPWRLAARRQTAFALSQAGNPYRDWLSPFIPVDEAFTSSAAWTEFWLHLTSKTALPRHWLRWAHSFVQRFRKVSSGSPGDAQLLTYLIETDVFITADKALLQILEEIRPFAPCELPVGVLVAAGPEAAEDLVSMLERKEIQTSTLPSTGSRDQSTSTAARIMSSRTSM